MDFQKAREEVGSCVEGPHEGSRGAQARSGGFLQALAGVARGLQAAQRRPVSFTFQASLVSGLLLGSRGYWLSGAGGCASACSLASPGLGWVLPRGTGACGHVGVTAEG